MEMSISDFFRAWILLITHVGDKFWSLYSLVPSEVDLNGEQNSFLLFWKCKH